MKKCWATSAKKSRNSGLIFQTWKYPDEINHHVASAFLRSLSWFTKHAWHLVTTKSRALTLRRVRPKRASGQFLLINVRGPLALSQEDLGSRECRDGFWFYFFRNHISEGNEKETLQLERTCSKQSALPTAAMSILNAQMGPSAPLPWNWIEMRVY